MRSAVLGFRKFNLSKSEMILRSAPKYSEPHHFEQSYNKYLSEIKDKRMNDISDVASFPLKTFKKFPKTTMERLIKSSYDFVKSNKNATSVYSFNAILLSYITHNIDCDVSEILQDMNNSNVKFNELTYSLLINLYSDRGDMNAIENIMKTMNSNGLTINERSKHNIYGGYIRSKQFNEAKRFIEENNIKEDNVFLLIQKCKAYADIDDFKEVTETLKLIKEIDNELTARLAFKICHRLIKAMSPDSEIDEILSFANVDDFHQIANFIFLLNREGFYNHSMRIMLKYNEKFVEGNLTADIIKSFGVRDCPINIYSNILEKFTGRIFPNAYLNLFANMDFETALNLSEGIINIDNSQCICCNLLMKAIKDKSIKNIEVVLHIIQDKLFIRNVNTVIQYVLIPAMMENGLVSEPHKILELLPHDKVIIPSLLMHYLCKGDFNSFQKLMDQNISSAPIKYSNFSRTSAKNILDNIPFKEIEKVAFITAKIFSPQFVNWLIGSVICERIVQAATVDNIAGIEDAIKVANNFGTGFEKKDFEYLEKYAPKYQQMFKDLKLTEARYSDDTMQNVSV